MEDLNLEEGRARGFSGEVDGGMNSFSGEFQRNTYSGVEIQGISTNIELPQSSCDFIVKGLLYVKKILDPQKPIGFWIFLTSSVIAISVDPLFFYVPFIDENRKCLGFDRKLHISSILLYALFGLFYMTYANLLLPSSLNKKEVKTCLRCSLIDILVIFPLPLVLLTLDIDIPRMGVDIFMLPMSFFVFQYLLRVIRISILFMEATRISGILAEAKWAKVAFNLLLVVHGGHVFGALWYFFAVERSVTLWKIVCPELDHSNYGYFRCSHDLPGYLRKFNCTTLAADPPMFDFGIFKDAFEQGIVRRPVFLEKFLYCLRWGLQNISCFGQSLQPTTLAGENIFVICITTYALVVFVFLIGNMQTYLQSETKRSEQIILQGRETEQWMSFCKLSEKLRKEMKKYQPYKGLESKSVDLENLVNKLPKDLRKNVKRELCLELLRKVEEFGKLSESSLEDLCDCLKPVSFTKGTRIVREGDPIDETLFVVQGKLQTYTSRAITSDSPTTDHSNRKNDFLKDGEFCGKVLITWVHADPYSFSLPISTTTILAVTNVEAFALLINDLQNVFVRHQAIHFIQSFWRFRRVLSSKRNAQTSVRGADNTNTVSSGTGS